MVEIRKEHRQSAENAVRSNDLGPRDTWETIICRVAQALADAEAEGERRGREAAVHEYMDALETPAKMRPLSSRTYTLVPKEGIARLVKQEGNLEPRHIGIRELAERYTALDEEHQRLKEDSCPRQSGG